MATSTFLSLTCTPQSMLHSKHKSHTQSSTMSLLSPQLGQKCLYNPLRHNVSSPIQVKPKRIHVGGLVKASMNSKDVHVLSKEHLAVSLAKYIADLSEKYIREKGLFTVVLSPGPVKYLRYYIFFPLLHKTLFASVGIDLSHLLAFRDNVQSYDKSVTFHIR